VDARVEHRQDRAADLSLIGRMIGSGNHRNYGPEFEKIASPENTDDTSPNANWCLSNPISLHKIDSGAQTRNFDRCRNALRSDLQETPAVNTKLDYRALVTAE
jgi:hypothetical protein